jgi:hypothetical protein
MARRGFWSLPAGWREAFPWGLLLGVATVGLLVAAEGQRGGRAALDRVFWVEAAVLFPLVVLGGTAVVAGRRARRGDPP